MSKRLIRAGIAMLVITAVFVTYFNLGVRRNSLAASNGDYRSVTSGNWGSASTWEKYNGTSWIPAGTAPVSADGVITIRDGHTVTIAATASADQIVVDNGGILSATNNTFTIANGTGTDLIVNGTFNIASQLSLNAGVTVDINNLGIIKAGGNINFGIGSFFNVNGRFSRTGGNMPTTALNWSINDGGIFEHAINGGSLLPSASWKTGSTCEVTGITTNMPANITQVFYHFTWNCPNQTAGFDFNAKFDWVNGDLKIISTGGSSLQFDYQGNNNTTNIGGNLEILGGLSYGCANGSAIFNIGGDYIQSGGIFAFNQSWASGYGNTSTSLNIAGNLVMTGGMMDMTQSTANNAAVGKGHINLIGNISLSDSALLTQTSADSHGEICFAGTSIQYYDLNDHVTNKIDFIINSGAIVRTEEKILTSQGDFYLLAGGHLMIGSTEGIMSSAFSGNVQVSGSRSYSTGADYTYEATSAQVSGDGLPLQVRNLTLNNPFNCTLSRNTSVSSTLTFNAGLWIATTDTLTLGISTAVRGTLARVTGHVVGYFKRWVANAIAANILFPVGTLTNYNGANFSFTTAPSSGGGIISSFVPVNPGKTGLPQTDAAEYCENIGYAYWTFGAANGLSNGSWTVNLIATGFPNIFDYTKLHVCRRNGTGIPWSFNGSHTAGTGSNAAPVANRTAMTLLGHYGITSGSSNPLPVQLLSFEAEPVNNIVNLTWVTASERSNNYFTVERSTDGKKYFSLEIITGSGSSSVMHKYGCTDKEPLPGISYYRLKQTDFNGEVSLSGIKTVNREAANGKSIPVKVTTGPNPFSDECRVIFNTANGGETIIELYSANGTFITHRQLASVAGDNEYIIDGSHLKAGMYVLRITVGQEVVVSRIIKK